MNKRLQVFEIITDDGTVHPVEAEGSYDAIRTFLENMGCEVASLSPPTTLDSHIGDIEVCKPEGGREHHYVTCSQ